MIPHTQLNGHNPEAGDIGDCWRTCIACLLDMHPADVPHFVAGAVAKGDVCGSKAVALTDTRAWLRERGLGLFQVGIVSPMREDGLTLAEALEWAFLANPGQYMILGGQTKGGINHSVIVLDGEIVHDPAVDIAFLAERGSVIVGPHLPGGEWLFNVITPCVPPVP